MCKYNRRAMDSSLSFVVFLTVLVFAFGYMLGALNENERITDSLKNCDTDADCEQVWESLK